MSSDLTIRSYRPGDERGILDTFNRVFREVCGPGYVDRTLAQWTWQYIDNPAGFRIWLAVAPDGAIASQYAGVPMFVDSPWGELRFIHCVDSMTHPDWRQGLKRPGVFVVTGKPYTAYLRKVGDAVAYGFPVDVAYRIGVRYLEDHFLRAIDFLLRSGPAGVLPAPARVQLERVREIPADVDALYGKVRADKQLLLRRNRGYLDWRYVQNPARADYELWTARRGGELCGFVVLKPTQALIPDAATIADWLCPERDDETAAALLHVATRRAHEAGGRSLLAVFPDWSAEAALLRKHAFVLTPSANWLERRLVHLVMNSPLTGDFLAERWWYTLGDSDLA